MTKNLREITLWLASSWLIIGICFTILSFFHLFYFSAFCLLVVPAALLVAVGIRIISIFTRLSDPEKFLLSALILIWLMHLTGVFVPETGFDAVWYHLPVAQAVIGAQGLIVLPELYQSLNPLFSDVLFTAGFGLGKEFGAKIVAYGLAATLILVTYQLARLKLSRFWSLWLVICVSLFQVITWQASSFYVDVAKALWEISALWMLLKTENKFPRNMLAAGLFFGASIATKAFSWILLPVLMYCASQNSGTIKRKSIAIFLLGCLSLGLPFYLHTWVVSGTPFLSIGLHLEKLHEIGGNSSFLNYSMERIVAFPLSLWTLIFLVRDYTSIVLIIFFPLVVYYFGRFWRDEYFRSLLIFGIAQYGLWWFLPPLSTRYALSGFIVLLLIAIAAAEKSVQKNRHFFLPLVLTLIVSSGINLVPRIVVVTRNLEYQATKPSLEKYITQFYDGSIDQHLKRWYQLSN